MLKIIVPHLLTAGLTSIGFYFLLKTITQEAIKHGFSRELETHKKTLQEDLQKQQQEFQHRLRLISTAEEVKAHAIKHVAEQSAQKQISYLQDLLLICERDYFKKLNYYNFSMETSSSENAVSVLEMSNLDTLQRNMTLDGLYLGDDMRTKYRFVADGLREVIMIDWRYTAAANELKRLQKRINNERHDYVDPNDIDQNLPIAEKKQLKKTSKLEDDLQEQFRSIYSNLSDLSGELRNNLGLNLSLALQKDNPASGIETGEGGTQAS